MIKYILAGSVAVVAVGVVFLKSDLACEYSPIDLSYINDCSAQAEKAKTADVNTSEAEKGDQSAGSQEITQTGTSEDSTTNDNDEAAAIIENSKPTFDIVRVEPDGSTLVAGRGAPNSTIILKDGEKTIGEATTNESGEWVIIVDEPIQAATASLSLTGMLADGTSVESDAIVNIAMRNEETATQTGNNAPVIAATDNAKMEALATKLAAMNENGGVTLSKLESSQDESLKALALKLRNFGNDGSSETTANDELNLSTIASQLSKMGEDNAIEIGDSGIDFNALAAKLTNIDTNPETVVQAPSKTEMDMASLADKLAKMKASGGVTLAKLDNSQDKTLQELAAKLRSFGDDENAVVKNATPNDELNLTDIAQHLLKMNGEDGATSGDIDLDVLATKLTNIDKNKEVASANMDGGSELDMNALATKLAKMNADGGVTLDKLKTSDDVDLKALAAKLSGLNDAEVLGFTNGSSDGSLDLGVLAAKLAEMNKATADANGSATNDGIDLTALAAKLTEIKTGGLGAMLAANPESEMNIQSLASKLANLSKDGSVSIDSLAKSDDLDLKALAVKLANVSKNGMVSLDSLTTSDDVDLNALAQKLSLNSTGELMAMDDSTSEDVLDTIGQAVLAENEAKKLLERVEKLKQEASSDVTKAMEVKTLETKVTETKVEMAKTETVADKATDMVEQATEAPSADTQEVATNVDVATTTTPKTTKTVVEKAKTAQPVDKTPLVVISEKGKGSKVLQGAGGGSKNNEMTFNSVDFNGKGEMIFSGDAKPNELVRVYVNNQLVGEAKADNVGNWSLDQGYVMKSGPNTMRFDQVDDQGSVVSRRETNITMPKLAKPKVKAVATKTTSPKAVSTDTDSNKSIMEPTAVANDNTEGQMAKDSEQENANAIVTAKTDVNSDENTADEPKAKGGRAIIIWGDNLWNISQKIYGKGELYTTIFKANQDQIRNPDLIYPGQVFLLPEDLEEKL